MNWWPTYLSNQLAPASTRTPVEGVPRSAVLAYKWLNLAASHAPPNDREDYLRIREAVASKLNNAQLAEAQWLAYTWERELPSRRGHSQ